MENSQYVWKIAKKQRKAASRLPMVDLIQTLWSHKLINKQKASWMDILLHYI